MKSATSKMLEGGGHSNPADAGAPEGKRKRILLIEDDSSTRLVLLQKLRSAGFEVDVAVNGTVGLGKIRTGHPDAIFMDLLLPSSKGVDVIKAARQDEVFANRPIYVCTSAAMMNLWTKRGTKAGATKVFDRASTPIDTIVAEVAAELFGRGTISTTPRTTAPENATPEEHQATPNPPEVKVNVAETSPEPPGQNKHDKPATSQSPAQPFNFMKRVAKTFGLDWTSRRSSESDAPANPKPVQSAQGATASEPVGGSFAEQSSTTATPAPEPASPTDDAGISQLEGISVPATDASVAVLTLDEAAKILSANKNCTTMFGWEGPALVGQSLKHLLKEGLDDDIEKLLQQQRSGGESKVTSPLLTVARKKDGTEFPVSITTLTWSSDTTMMRKSDAVVFCWTAFIRDMASRADSQGQAAVVVDQAVDQNIQPASTKSEALEADVFQPQERLAAIQTGQEELQQQLQEISTEAAVSREALKKHAQEREDLAGRVFKNEAELNKARAELERESQGRKQLEQKLQDLKAELDKQMAERARLESEWRDQLQCAEALTKKLEAGWLEEAGRNKGLEERLQIFGNSLKLEQVERSKRFEEEVLSLRNERDALYGKLTEEQLATTEFKRRTEELEARLRDSADEAQSVKAELERQTEEQKHLESEWREKLQAAESLTSRLEAAWTEAEEQNKRTEEELTSLRQIRDELKGQLAAEQEAAAESGRKNDELAARVIQNTIELERIRAELAKVGRNEQFEEQLTGLEQAREALNGELRTERQVTAESRQRSEEIEGRLRENSAELERVKADAERHAEEQARLESELQNQLDAANSAAEQTEAALKEKASQCSQFEIQLATLEKLRDELDGKLATEQEATAKSKQRSEELENQLRERAAELEQVKAEREKQAEEQVRLESELRAQLEAAKAAAGQAEAALNEQAAQNRGFEERLRIFGNSLRLQHIESSERFENELTSLQKVRDDLGGKLAEEQQAAVESRQRVDELGTKLRETATELERVQAELSRHSQERAQLESEQRAQLDAAKAATEKAEAACLEETARSKRFEGQLADIREERDQLNHKFEAEQQALAESRRHGEELENRHRTTAAELERVQAKLARHEEELAQRESEHRTQLNAGKTATEKAEAARLEEAERSKQVGEELTGLRRDRDQLNQKLATEQEAVAESKRRAEGLQNRLSETAAELERVRAELARRTEERSSQQSEQSAQLNAAKAAAEQAETALIQKTALCSQSQEEAASLWRECETLSAKLTAEQQSAAQFKQRSEELENRLRENAEESERVKAAQGQQSEEQKRLEAEWREQLSNAEAAATHAEEARKEAVTQQRQLERTLTNLRNERHQVYDRFKAEHAAGEKSKRRIGELEKRLRERGTQLKRTKSELEKQTAERGRQETELRGQLQTSRANAERELGSLRLERESLNGQLTTAQQAAAEFRQRSEELENRFQDNAAELERVRAELDQRNSEWTRREAEHQTFIDTKEALGLELRQLRESEAARKADITEMEGRLAESIGLLARAVTELENERSERQRLERRAASLAAELQKLHEELKEHLGSEQANEHRIAELLQQLQERDAAVTKISMDLQKEIVNRQAAEEQLRATADLSSQLREHLNLIEEAKKVFESRQKDLESRLQANLDALRESESNVEKETNERRRLEGELQAAQRERQRQSESNAIELSRLQSAIQVEQLERKGLEAQAIQSRYSSLDSARVGAAMVNNFRNRVRQPIDKLMESTRRLLEAQLPDEQKKLVESLLENALLLQTSIRENGPSNESNAAERSDNPRAADATRPQDVVSKGDDGNLQP